MHRLATSFVLGFHGCDRQVGEQLLAGEAFRPSQNDYDWLGGGIYFWEANPLRGIHFAKESASRRGAAGEPFVVGAIIELGLCLDLTTTAGISFVKLAFGSLVGTMTEAGIALPTNGPDRLRRRLDCAVISRFHAIRQEHGESPVDTVRAAFHEGAPVYPDSGFFEKTHVQIAVRNPRCIKGVFRVPAEHLRDVL